MEIKGSDGLNEVYLTVNLETYKSEANKQISLTFVKLLN